MKKNEAFPTATFSAADFLASGPLIYKIKNVEMQTLGIGADADTKPVCEMHDAAKTLVLNATRWSVIEAMYGPETDDWRGRPIELYAGRTQYQGRQVDCVSVRPPQQQQPQQQQQQQQQTQQTQQTRTDTDNIPF